MYLNGCWECSNCDYTIDIKTANEGRTKNCEPELTEDDEDLIESNINDLLNLGIYSLPTIKISSKADEEDVADIFVRVNSGGQNLLETIGYNDDRVRNQIANFTYPDYPTNIDISPIHLL